MCYKESNQEQLEAFTEELKQEGKLTKETETLLKQLEDTKPPEDNETTETESYLVNTQSVYCIYGSSSVSSPIKPHHYPQYK